MVVYPYYFAIEVFSKRDDGDGVRRMNWEPGDRRWGNRAHWKKDSAEHRESPDAEIEGETTAECISGETATTESPRQQDGAWSEPYSGSAPSSRFRAAMMG